MKFSLINLSSRIQSAIYKALVDIAAGDFADDTGKQQSQGRVKLNYIPIEPQTIHLEHPANEEHGDYSSNIAMAIFSKFQIPHPPVSSAGRTNSKFPKPQDLAQAIVDVLRDNKELSDIVSNISVGGPGFINFWLSKNYLAAVLSQVIAEKDNFGKSKILAGKKILLEHTSPDPIKTMHIGHLRNNFLGMSCSAILRFLGAKVVNDAINNDRGTHVSQAILGFLAFADKESGVTSEELLNFSLTEKKIGKILKNFSWRRSLRNWLKEESRWYTPADLGLKSDHFDLRVYSAAAKGVRQFPQFKKQIQEILLAWEDENPNVLKVWRKIIDWSLKGYKITYQRIGSHHDYVWHESDLYKGGKELVIGGLKKGIFRKSKGAVVTNLAEYGLPDTILIRSDGTALYLTFDINLTLQKRKKFPSDLYIWDIGNDQQLYLKQQFAVCEQLGIGKRSDYFHLNYGYVYLKGKGKMSSREGTIVSADELIDILVERSRAILEESKRIKVFGQREREEISKVVGLAALKYAMLKNNRLSDIYFDIDESVSLEGDSGPYLQYTHARCKSVIKKSKVKSQKSKVSLNGQRSKIKCSAEELSILRWIYRFPEVVAEAGRQYAPNLICSFLFELAQRFNVFYHQHSILKADNKEQRHFRLLLTAAVAQVVANGLNLLGIRAPDKM